MASSQNATLSFQTAPPAVRIPNASIAVPAPAKVSWWSQQLRRWWKWQIPAVLLVFLVFVNYFNVDRTLTDEDRKYIKLYLPNTPEGIAHTLPFEEQIRLIERAQQAVHQRTTGWVGIPEGQPREPKQLYLGRTGLCYDRSRVLEKIFTYLGFPNRHLALFMRESGMHSYETLLFHHVPSHAISEVKTTKGWLMVDSNRLWISLDDNYQPISMPQMQIRYKRGEKINWAQSPDKGDDTFYNSRCIALYGLYSRHGRFYPPYAAGVPDYRVRGLFYNFEQLGD